MGRYSAQGQLVFGRRSGRRHVDHYGWESLAGRFEGRRFTTDGATHEIRGEPVSQTMRQHKSQQRSFAGFLSRRTRLLKG